MNKSFTLIAFMAGVLGGLLLDGHRVQAHPPCDDYTPPTCKYIQVVNPYTGQLETEYVCD